MLFPISLTLVNGLATLSHFISLITLFSYFFCLKYKNNVWWAFLPPQSHGLWSETSFLYIPFICFLASSYPFRLVVSRHCLLHIVLSQTVRMSKTSVYRCELVNSLRGLWPNLWVFLLRLVSSCCSNCLPYLQKSLGTLQSLRSGSLGSTWVWKPLSLLLVSSCCPGTPSYGANPVG